MILEPTAELRQQYDALIDGVGVCPLPGRTQIEVTGNDRTTFLHNFCTNDVKQLQPGGGCEAFFLSVQGKVLAHTFIFCLDDALIIETVAGQGESLIAHLDRYLITEDVELHDRSTDWGEVIISGGESADFLASLLGGPPPAEMLGHRIVELSGAEISVRKVPMTNADCFLTSCKAEAFDEVVKTLLENSTPVYCSEAALETCRIEAAFPLYGQDITDKSLPQEVCRDEQAITLTKGCYLGQETVARIDALGHVNWNLAVVKFDSPTVPDLGTELTMGDKSVGRVTSATFSFRLSAPLALAVVRREHNTTGTQFTTPAGSAEVVSLPV